MVRRGFTIIEIMVVVILIGIITAIGLPRFFRSPVPVTQEFIHRLNSLLSEAVEQAQKESEPRRIFFNLGTRTVEIQTIQGRRIGRTVSIPEVLEVSDVVINGVSQFQIAGEKRTVYFLINAEGMSQEVLLVLSERFRSGDTRQYEFYLNPFSALFRVH